MGSRPGIIWDTIILLVLAILLSYYYLYVRTVLTIDAHARTEVCALNLGIVTYIRTATLDRIQEQRGSHHFPILYSKPLNLAMARQWQSSLLN